MKMKATIAAAAMLALGGCDMITAGLAGGDNASADNNVETAAGNITAGPFGDKRAGASGGEPYIADAGITTSRSLQAFAGGGEAMGGKDMMASGGGIGGLSPGALVGRWADNADCSMDIHIFDDGTFRSFNGGQGSWRLDGDRLHLSGDGGTFTLRIQAFDGRSMQVVNPDGSVGRSQRC